MRYLAKYFYQIVCIMLLVFAVASENAFAEVTVYGEGLYTQTELTVYIYADITNSTELRSAGIKLTYDTSELYAERAAKNESVWSMGNDSYVGPDISTDGEVVIFLAKFDSAAPAQGVTGSRTLLGKVKFKRTDRSMPFSPTLGLELGKQSQSGEFENFVDVNKSKLDDAVAFGEVTLTEQNQGCINTKLKVVANLCKEILASYKKEVKTQKSSGDKRDNAKQIFNKKWDKLNSKYGNCNDTYTMDDIYSDIDSKLSSLYDNIYLGLQNKDDKNARNYGKALLAAARAKCYSYLKAEIANKKRPNDKKMLNAKAKADKKFENSCDKADKMKVKKQVNYTGPDMAAISASIEALVDNVMLAID